MTCFPVAGIVVEAVECPKVGKFFGFPDLFLLLANSQPSSPNRQGSVLFRVVCS